MFSIASRIQMHMDGSTSYTCRKKMKIRLLWHYFVATSFHDRKIICSYSFLKIQGPRRIKSFPSMVASK